MMVLPQSGHAVHEDHPDKVYLTAFSIHRRSVLCWDCSAGLCSHLFTVYCYV